MPRAVHFFFFFNDTATTEIYTLSLHDALPIFAPNRVRHGLGAHLDHHHPIEVRRRDLPQEPLDELPEVIEPDRKSTRLNSSHGYISYAVFCLKKKTKTKQNTQTQHSYTAAPGH